MTKILEKFKEKPVLAALSVIFVVAAAFLRFLALDNKPIHFDESINMWFVQKILQDGYFTYDPTNYHGPLMFYLTHFVSLFTGFDFISTRWVAALFSFLTLVLLWFGPKSQRLAFRWASLFLLFSPAMGFYGRSGIHESGFVFFQVLGFMSFHYLLEKDFNKFWWSFAGSLFGMMALKETFVVLILAIIPALVMVAVVEKRKISYQEWSQQLKDSFQRREVYRPLFAMLLFFLGIYSGFGANPKGLVDFFVALVPWLKTGVHGSGHEKEFLYWTQLMAKNEFLLLAGFLLGVVVCRRKPWLRFYVVVSFTLWLIYSLIPYKTPWCLISIAWPLALVGGMAMVELMKAKSAAQRGVVVIGVALLCAAESKIHYELVYQNPIKMTHPYVYVNSTYQMKEFIEKTQGLIAEQPLLREQVVQVGTEESWPIPIVFHKFYNLSYHRPNAKVEDLALIYLVDEVDQKNIEEKLKQSGQLDLYQRFSLDVRQSRKSIFVYVKREHFQNRFSWPLEDVGPL